MLLEVVLPRRGRVDAEAAIRERLGWIREEYSKMLGTKRILGPNQVMFEGRFLKIVRLKGPGDVLTPDLGKEELRVQTSDGRGTQELVRRWFLKESSAYVVKRVKELAPAVGVRPAKVDVREIGKWGYCTRTGRLSFSWQIIALPERLREYVVLHELTHLVHFDHSSLFRRKLESVCPDFRSRERELDQIVPYDRMTVG